MCEPSKNVTLNFLPYLIIMTIIYPIKLTNQFILYYQDIRIPHKNDKIFSYLSLWTKIYLTR